MLGEEDVVLPYAGVLKSPETLKRVRLAEAQMSRKKLKDTKIVIHNEAAVAEPRKKLVGTGTVTINRLGKVFKVCVFLNPCVVPCSSLCN